jgi:hypothetical protein
MNEYQMGKDIEALTQRIAAIEKQLLKDSPCGCSDGEGSLVRAEIASETRADETKAGIEALASKTFRWPDADRLGNCELRGGYTLTLFSDGRYRAIGTRKCNAGGINSCKKFEVSIELYRGACSDNPPAVVRTVVKSGAMGGGSESAFTADGRDDVIQQLYNEIKCAAMWVNRCQTGV